MAAISEAPMGLRAALDAVLAELPARLRVPGQGGAACRAISDVYDSALAERFTAAAQGEDLALVATGGWARRELAPYSDIDFIILHDRDEALAKRVSDALLYPLWDEKLAIGHAVREPRAAARLGKDDLATATALLDARHIAGERRLTTDLVRATLAALSPGGNPNDLIASLAAEKRARHDRFGASLYLLEPNLKQGIGALRDLATALWCAQVRWRPPRPGEDPEDAERRIAALVEMGHLNRRQAQILAGARDFQLRIRALVQLTAKRRFDQLTFEVQEAIAPALYPDAKPHEGDVRSAVAPAVEALMREYYLHARGVVQVSDALLESALVARRKPRIAHIDSSFITFNGELAIKDPRLFVDRPSEMIRIFRVAVAEQLAVYAHTRELIAEAIAKDPTPLAQDPLAPRLLLEALADPRDSAQPSAMEVMNQLGILSVLMPAWAPCVGRVQHDLYHVYTVDQHQLYALAMQKRIARGELAAEHPLATELWREVKRPASLLLGTLLHDVGKPLGKGHAEKGAVVTEAIAKRFGMNDLDADLAAFLVRQHLTMSHLSQRRDLADPEVIARFAERIGDDEHLVQLYLVTLCDTAMTSPDNLSAWKDGLLRDLLVRTRAHFRGGGGDSSDAQDAAYKAKVLQSAVEDEAQRAELTAILDGVDPRLFAQLTPRQTARHVRLVSAARAQSPHVALDVRCYPLKGHSELAVVAPDAPGVLAAIAGALTANRVDVLGAVLGHVDLEGRRLVTDVFYVRDLKGEAIPEDDIRWKRLASDLKDLLAGDKPDSDKVATLIARRRPTSTLPKRVTPGVVTDIKLHDDSTQATIVEVATRDRVGVLYAITHTLAELGLDISLAKVATEGEKVSDVFYVTRRGERITDSVERAVILQRLRMAVDAPGLTGS
ncbi:MAG: [protein-PII] uridylyltransferase [Myxococcales bacterium]|nr:[protein-PII] uridylyltransferase [Myxococcales bacterium]